MKTTFIYNKIIKTKYILSIICFLSLSHSCEDFLEVEIPKNQVLVSVGFDDKYIAEATINSLYAKLRDESVISGNIGLGLLMGLYSDELQNHSNPGSDLDQFYNHQIIASNATIKSLWARSYHIIFLANDILEAIENSHNLNANLKKQYKGEVLFIRAFSHFSLVNLFGEIPYIKSTSILENQNIAKINIDHVYENVINDLIESKMLLDENYPTSERVRVNKYTTSALLSRVYLYKKEWQKAVLESSEIIQNSTLYSLETDLNKEFLKESSSAIFQLKPKINGHNTHEGSIFWIGNGPPNMASLSNDFIQEFEDLDLRKSHWIREVNNGSSTWYSPFKYKQFQSGNESTEYSIIFRLSEQYLIRSEANINLGNTNGAIEDINHIRVRAGLPNIDFPSSINLYEELIKQRKLELFAEQGHRWFDLKRWEIADNILSPIKTNWNSTNILFPIPETELMLNPNLLPQNSGY